MESLYRFSSLLSLTTIYVFVCCLQPFAAGKSTSQDLKGTSGDLTSPNYPNHYRSYSNCSWNITVPEGQTTQLTFLDFLLEKDYACNADAVRVYDGKDTSATLLGSYCGGMQPFSIYSTTNHVYVRFTSDRSLNYRGFRARYTVNSQATAVTALTTTPTTLTPTTPQAMIFVKRIRNVTTVQIGNEVKFQCQVTGARKIKIVWSKDANAVNSDRIKMLPYVGGVKSILKIRKVVKEDAGEYGCIASDDASNFIHSSGSLVVQEPLVTTATASTKPTAKTRATVKMDSYEIPFITNPPRNMTANYGKEVLLICEAKGLPPPSVSWFMCGKLVANNTSNFKFKVAKDVTQVTCEARNLHGKDVRNAFVKVDKPAAATLQAKELDTSWGRGTLVVVILCVLLALIFVALVVIVYDRNRNHVNHMKMPLPSNLEQLAQNPIFEQSSNDYGNPQLEKWELPRNNIDFMNDLVDGTFFHIFLGKINHPTRGAQGSLVMVKALKETNPSRALKDSFDEDAFRWAMLDHPNVQSLVGVCAVDRPLCLVFEYEDLSNLGSFLRDCGRSRYMVHQNSDVNDTKLELSNLDQIGIATQIAAGMEYLSTRGHIHKELCVKNCVINTDSMAVKISNLGFSWLTPSTSYHTLSSPEQEKYPVRWLPPEAILEGVFGDETDIWSFGVVLWEIYSSGLKPYYGMGNEEVISIVREGDMLPCPKECPKEVYQIMCECWQMKPSDRPLFSTIHQKISTLYSGVAV